MTIKYFLSAIALILCITLILNELYSQDDEMKKTALSRLNEWKKTFSEDQVQKLGFDSKADFKASELGTPFKLYTVNPDAMMGYQEGSKFEKIVTETNYWIYPVISSGENKALLWIMKKEDKWQVARIGSSKLAKNIRTNEGTIRDQTSEKGLEGAELPKFVRVYQLYLDFFFIKTAEKEYIIPMQTIPILKIEGSKFYTPAQVVPHWKEQLKKKMPPEEEGKRKKIEG